MRVCKVRGQMTCPYPSQHLMPRCSMLKYLRCCCSTNYIKQNSMRATLESPKPSLTPTVIRRGKKKKVST
jgi:hypothetical protein